MQQPAFKIILWLLTFGAPLSLLASSECDAISPATRDRLVQYVHDKFQLPPGTSIELIDSEPIADSCYRKVYFRRADTAEQIMMFLSSDQRFLSRELFDSAVDLSEQRKAEQRRLEIELAKGDFPTKGDSAAPITVVLFSDFQCPYCKKQAEILKQGFYEAEIRVVFRNFPLTMDPWAGTAAESARCVYQQNRDAFWDLHDSLFQNQEQMTTENIQKFIHTLLLRRTDLQVSIYDECLSTHRAAAQIQTDLRFAMDNNLHATPTMFINGIRVEGVRTANQIRTLVNGAVLK